MLRISFDDIAREMAHEINAGKRAVSAAVTGAGARLKSTWRGQITGAGLGARLANTIRAKNYPEGRASLSAASFIWSKAPTIVGAHEDGATIRARGGRYLSIPTEAAGRGRGGRRETPEMWQARTGLRLRPVRARGGRILLVAEGRQNARGRLVASKSKTGRGLASAVIFILVPQVGLRKRLDLAGAANAAADGLPSEIVREWDRQ